MADDEQHDPISIEGGEMDRIRSELHDICDTAKGAAEELDKIRWSKENLAEHQRPNTDNISVLVIQSLSLRLEKVCDRLHKAFGPIET